MKRERSIFINGIKTKYSVTDQGSVYTSDFRHTKKRKRLKTRYDKDGYEIATIYLDGKRYDFKVHRLVASAFIPNPNNKPEVNHRNGNKKKNNKGNLEWVTNQENITHSIVTGLKVMDQDGDKNPMNKYPKKIIKKICKALEKNEMTLKEISKKYDVPVPTISSILNKHQWLDVSSNYNIDNFDKKRKYTDDTIIVRICELLSSGKYTLTEVSKKMNVKYKLVYRVYTGESHKNISNHYDFSKVKIKDK